MINFSSSTGQRNENWAISATKKAINEQLAWCGFFLVGETDFTKATAEVLELYRRRNVIEKSFDDLKNGVGMKRLHCHSNETAEGKSFVAFLALIVRAYMQNKLGSILQSTIAPLCIF